MIIIFVVNFRMRFITEQTISIKFQLNYVIRIYIFGIIMSYYKLYSVFLGVFLFVKILRNVLLKI